MNVPHPNAVVLEVFGQILGHLLGQRRHQHALLLLDADADLAEQIVHLPVDRAHLHLGIEQAGRADDLLHRLLAVLLLVDSGCRADEDGLVDLRLELLKIKRPVVVG